MVWAPGSECDGSKIALKSQYFVTLTLTAMVGEIQSIMWGDVLTAFLFLSHKGRRFQRAWWFEGEAKEREYRALRS